MIRPGPRERGASTIEYAGLVVVAALILGVLVATGMPAKVSSGTGTTICRILHSGASDCGRTTAAGGTDETAGTGRPDDGGGTPRKGGCHGFWGCAWRTTKNTLGGAGSSLVSQASGIKNLFTTNPVTSGKNITKYVWSKSGGAMWDMAAGCTTGDWSRCRSGAACTAQNLYGPGCLINDGIYDDGVKNDLKNHKYAHAFGRLGTNIATTLLPTKIPGLGKLGKLGKGAKAADEAGKFSQAAKEADDALKQARGTRDAAKAKNLPPGGAQKIIKAYQGLSPAEKAKFLDRLSPQELNNLWQSADEATRSDILQNASKQTLARWKPPEPNFPKPTRWQQFNGKLFKGRPTADDIAQGEIGDCYCLSSMGAVANRSPGLIKKMIKQNPNGTYTVTFGDGTKTTVTGLLPEKAARAGGAGWAPIMEKALAQRYGGYDRIAHGGRPSDPLSKITGKPATEYAATKPSMSELAGRFRNRTAYVVGIPSSAKLPNAAARGITFNHAYTVVGVDKAKGTITLANPHGPHTPRVTLTEKELRDANIELFESPTR